MKIINRKNYVPIVCIIYTCMAIFKAILEGVSGHPDENYVQNYLIMLPIIALSVFVLSLHYYMQSIPVIIVIVVQYLLLIGVTLGFMWISSFFAEISKNAYRDMFLSFTIPYFLFCPVYYMQFYLQIRKANQMLPELMEEQKDERKEQE